MHKEDIIKNAKFYEHYLNKRSVYLKGQTTLTKGPFIIEEIKIEWLDIPKTSYDMRYILRHKYDNKCTISVREGDIILHLDDTEKRGIFNKIPKYSVNDIVIIGRDSFDVCGHNVVGIIKDVFNHRDTGDVFYHIIFNSGGLRKVFEREIETKFNTDKFKNGQLIYKQLLVRMYHTRNRKYLSEKEVIAWVYANFEVVSELDDPKYLERSLENLQQNSLYGMHPEYFPGYHFTQVRRPLKALDELNRREFERIAASPIRIEIDDMIKANYSKEEIKKMINKAFGAPVISLPLTYKKIIFSGPCTIILWTDGTKTIAKTSSDEEVFDPEKGVAICFMKKMLGHTETNKILRKASEQYEKYIAENRPNSSLDEFIEYLSSLKSKTKSVDHIDQSAIEEVKKLEEAQIEEEDD